ncbi:hypothetical protein [Acinetobacter calcoaceticus]|uniref:hypothetical protein n=1 Tax=Acinetobacter calcoaceticus TaxID=471 RepID=UPI00148F3AA1|nr:hypothetical protein [Acinetobacter calcoaceticus]
MSQAQENRAKEILKQLVNELTKANLKVDQAQNALDEAIIARDAAKKAVADQEDSMLV